MTKKNNYKLAIFIRQMRPRHWVKNLLIFIPIFASHEIDNADKWFNLSIYFISFNLLASGTYFINDIFDRSHDKSHKDKSKRPIASGLITIKLAGQVGGLLITLGLVIPILFLSVKPFYSSLTYLLLTFIYSFKVKRILALDVVLLSIPYTIRILGGSFAAEVTVSLWLLSFSIFIFSSLGTVKRFVEIIESLEKNLSGRGYNTADADIVKSFGLSCGVASSVILSLYVQSPDVVALYVNPDILLVAVPVVLFWIFYIWLMAGRALVNSDPIEWAINDKISRFVLLFLIILVLAATI